MRYVLMFVPLAFVVLGCTHKINTEIHPEFKPFFDEYEVEGSFLLYDFEHNKTLVYNEQSCDTGFLPASTFKIVNTLIGLETGIISGKNFVIPWDSVPRQVPAWNRDHKLASAFQNSVVPWYQELARRIGTEQMKEWVSKSYFGKMDIHDDNIDLFWLTGNSRITPMEQLDFQKKLINNELPYTKLHIELVKKIMVLEKTEEYTFRGKTGWAVMGKKNVGWLVGYLEIDAKKYAYSLNVESENEDATLFKKSRLEIVRKIFKHLSLI